MDVCDSVTLCYIGWEKGLRQAIFTHCRICTSELVSVLASLLTAAGFYLLRLAQASLFAGTTQPC